MTKENDPIRMEELCEDTEKLRAIVNEKIRRIMEEQLSDTGECILPGTDKYNNLKAFHNQYNHNYNQLKECVGHITLDIGSSTTDFVWQEPMWQEELHEIGQGIEQVKQDVMLPSFEILGPEVKAASRTAQELVDLMQRKQVSDGQFREIVSGLVRWHVLDDLQKQLRVRDFTRCFASIQYPTDNGGRRVENLYELADKERLRDTLEALYRERYSMSVAQGWSIAKERTQHFLLSFMLSLYHRPLEKLCGKMSAFCRFFSEVCGYGFVATRNLQNWFKAYQDFDWQRKRRDSRPPQNEPQKDYNTWMRRFRKFTAIEEMAAWMRGLYPQYQVTVA